MQNEIQNLIDHPETIRATLNIAQLDWLIRKCFCVHGLTLRMKYSVTSGGRFNEPRFNAESVDDLTASTGIFASVLAECRVGTFSQQIDWTETDGFKIWFQLSLRYKHFNGGSNGMNIASFWFENDEWTMSDYKNEKEENEEN